MAAYCAKEDLLIGDIPLAPKYGDGTSFVQLAADEIDAMIGSLYVTPVVWEDPPGPATIDPAFRPSKLMLKKINQLLASGRIVLDMAAGGEDRALHSYGKHMLDEALGLLRQIVSGDIILYGADQLEDTSDDQNNAVSVAQEDPYSMVEVFYQQRWEPPTVGYPPVPRPYDDRDLTA